MRGKYSPETQASGWQVEKDRISAQQELHPVPLLFQKVLQRRQTDQGSIGKRQAGDAKAGKEIGR